jgi:hypothetical protein
MAMVTFVGLLSSYRQFNVIPTIPTATPIESITFWRVNLQIIDCISLLDVVPFLLQCSEVVNLSLDGIDDVINGLTLSFEPEKFEPMKTWNAIKTVAVKWF